MWRTWQEYKDWINKIKESAEKRTDEYFSNYTERHHHKCFICGKNRGRVKVLFRKKKHYICWDCYKKHLTEIRKFGKIKKNGNKTKKRGKNGNIQ